MESTITTQGLQLAKLADDFARCMALLDASNATQRDLTANVLTLTSKLELANTKINTLQSIIQDNSNATEAKLTRFSQSVGEVKAAIQEVQKPP